MMRMTAVESQALTHNSFPVISIATRHDYLKRHSSRSFSCKITLLIQLLLNIININDNALGIRQHD